TLPAQVQVTRALNDAKQCLCPAESGGVFNAPGVSAGRLQSIERRARAARPTRGQLHAALRLFVTRVAARALVEDHHDVRTERRLHFHRDFRRQETQRTVDVRPKLRAFFADLAQRAQAPDLEPAGVGE